MVLSELPLLRLAAFAMGAALSITLAPVAFAAWPPDGFPLANSPNSEVSPVGLTGLDGGLRAFWIAYDDPAHIVFAQQLTIAGTIAPGWPARGRGVVTRAALPGRLQIIDDPDGALLAWFDHRTDHGIYAVRVDGAGVVMPGWSADANPVCTFNSAGYGPLDQLVVPCTDGAGGAFIAWVDTRGTTSPGPLVYDVYAQHVRGDGTLDPTWPAGGRGLVIGSGYKYPYAMVADGAGGFWLASEKADDTSKLAVTRFAANGDSIASWSTPSFASRAAMTGDGAGGIFLAWSDCRDCPYGYDAAYAMRLTGNAAPVSGWPPGGVRVAGDDAGLDDLPAITATGDGAAMIAWRRILTFGELLLARRIEGDGTFGAGWSTHRMFATTPGTGFGWPLIARDGTGGAMFAFRGNTPNVFGSRVDAHGAIPAAFPDTGLALCSVRGNQDPTGIVSDGQNGAYVLWEDRRYWPTNGSDVYAMRFTRDGVVGGTDGVPSPPVSPSATIALSQPIPNPSSGPASFVVVLAQKSSARVEVMDLSGRVIRHLWDGSLGSGPHNFDWDGFDSDGREMPAGVYLLRAAVGSEQQTRRMVRLR